MKTSRAIGWLAAAAFAGIAFFAFLAWRSVTVEQAAAGDAQRRFGEIRGGFAGTEPLLRVEADGAVVRRPEPGGTAKPPRQLHVLAYRVAQQRLARADISFWFLKVKGPAAQFALRGTGLDMQRLGVTPSDLQRCGVCLILDETRPNGDRLLVWTE